jgi:hypothetical protein
MARSKPKLLTEDEAAEYLRIAPAQLARIRRAGGIGYVKIAQRSYRYTVAILDEYVRLCTAEPRLWIMIKEKDRRAREAAARRDVKMRDAVSSKDGAGAVAGARGSDDLVLGTFRRKKL